MVCVILAQMGMLDKRTLLTTFTEKQVTDKNNRRFRGFITKNKTRNKNQPLLVRTRS
jgi:hypothetical protein